MIPHGKNWWWIWPVFACIFGWLVIADWFDQPIHYDAQHTYLPAARAVLEQGWSFLLTPDSYRVAPLAYLWPALWGADSQHIRFANAILWAGCIYFLWRTCCLLGGYRTGVAAVALLAIHPELPRYFPTELTEPIFLFGIFGWIYAVSRIFVAVNNTWDIALLGAAMLTITLLSRPVLQLLAPGLLLASLAVSTYWRLIRRSSTSPWLNSLPCLSWSIALGLLLPLALLLKNGMVFGLWGLGTGSGGALYLGTHPLFQGTEPGFLGFEYDINKLAMLATSDGDHLSLANDRVLRSAAIWQMQSTSPMDALVFFGRKLWWWLAHHPAQADAFGSALRKLRLLEVLIVLASSAWLLHRWLRRNQHGHQTPFLGKSQGIFLAFLLAMFLAMLTQLLPVLYNSRYSSALLDPWLIPLVAWGLTYLITPIQLHAMLGRDNWSIGMKARTGTALWPAVGTLAAILVLTFGGYDLLRKNESIAVSPAQMGATRVHLDISASDRAYTYGMVAQNDRSWITTESPATLQIRIDSADIERITSAEILNALWKTSIALNSSQPCGKTDISYRTEDERILQPAYRRPLRLPLKADGVFHSIVTHANHELRPHEPGSLRIVLNCPVGTKVQWKDTQFLESRHIWDAAAHVTK